MSVRRIRLLFPGLLGLLVFLAGPVARADASAPTDNSIDPPRQRLAAPDFSLPSLDGRTRHLSDYRGKVVILNFWATFCAPCRREMPALETLWRDYRERGLVVLAVAADRGDVEIVQRFIDEGGYTFPVPLDPAGKVRNRYEVIALPMTYLIARDGRFSGRALGERQWDSPAIRSQLEVLLADD